MLLLVIGLVIAYKTQRRIAVPFAIFCIAWLFVMAVHTFQLLPYTALTPETQLCILLLVIAFIGGSIMAGHTRLPISMKSTPITLQHHQIYLRVIFILLLIGAAGLIMLILTNPVQLSLSMSFQRLSKGGNTLPPLYHAIHSVGLPALFAACILAITLHAALPRDAKLRSEQLTGALQLISRKYLRYLLLGGVIILVHDAVTLGRMFTSNYAILIFCAYLVISPPPKIHWKTVLNVGIGVGIVFLFAASITVLRSIATGTDILKSWLHYFCGSLGYFNLAVDSGLVQEMHWGRTTLMSVEAFLLRPYEWVPIIGKLIPSFPYYYEDRQTYYFVGSSRLFYNAFGTIMLDPYYDFGILGIPVVGGAVGWVTTYLYRLSQQIRTPLVMTMAVITTFWVCVSTIMWGSGWQTIVGVMPFWMYLVDKYVANVLKRQRRTAQLRAQMTQPVQRVEST